MKISCITIIALSLISLFGCSTTCVVGSKKGALERVNAETQIPALKENVEILITQQKLKPERILTVGHQIGNYEEYPLFPGEIVNHEFVSHKEMIRSFNNLKLDAIEVDVQLGPQDSVLYIHHESLKEEYGNDMHAWNYVQEYYNKNRLDTLLQTFIKKQYYTSKYLYIELKTKDAYLLSETEELTIVKTKELVQSTIQALIKDPINQVSALKHIAYISFNHLALKKMHDEHVKKTEELNHKLYYILGANGFWGMASRFCCNALNNGAHMINNKGEKHELMKKMLMEQGYLTGFWLSPNTLKNTPELIHIINQERFSSFGPDEQFEIFLSTYQNDAEDFMNSIKSENEFANERFYKNIRGIVFDVKK